MIITDVSIGIINFFQTKGITIMKKLFAILLAAVMVCTSVFCVPTFAADSALNAAGNSNQDVKVSVNHTLEETYAVDIEWGSLEFTYSTNYNWNQGNHSYSTTGGAWDQNSNTITVTNHSNRAVTVKTTYAPDENNRVDGVKIAVTGDSVDADTFSLNAGVENNYDDADNTTITVGFEAGYDEPTNKRENKSITVGSITITIG